MFHGPRLLTPRAFLQDAVRKIQAAQSRVLLLTTILNSDDSTDVLFDAITLAAERGLDVSIAADTYTLTELGGHFRFNARSGKRLGGVFTLRRKLTRRGAHFRWLGSYSSTLLNGRTHAKWLIVDNTVYSFGGINLYERGLANTDFFLRFNDVVMADRLAEEHQRIIAADRSGHGYRSHFFGNNDYSILVDGGFFGDSVIYRHACRLAEQAEHIVFVSQYCPTGKLSRIMKKKPTELYFNQWSRAESLNAALIRTSSYFSGNRSLYHRHNYLHAKFMLFTMPNGHKVALSGSHNFVRGGVWLGTREIAIETSNPGVISQLEAFLSTHISSR